MTSGYQQQTCEKGVLIPQVTEAEATEGARGQGERPQPRDEIGYLSGEVTVSNSPCVPDLLG